MKAGVVISQSARTTLRLATAIALTSRERYPDSTGSPIEDGLLADGDAAVAFVERESPDAPILFQGTSLGAGFAVAKVAKYPSKGLYLGAPFDTMTAVATGHYPFVPGFILRDTFRSVDRIRTVTAPMLAVHGLADGTIPPERGRTLAASAARGVKFIAIPGVGHNDVFVIRDVEAEAMFRELAAEPTSAP
jgi:uncharacterized protein